MARHRLLVLDFGCSISTLWNDLFAPLVPFCSEHGVRQYQKARPCVTKYHN